jgi:pyruvate/2-oxoacid:ferredoxin oxidoreductase beta subunit
MDKYTLYAGQFLPFHEYYAPAGHKACSGSGTALALRLVYKGLDSRTQNITKARWAEPGDHAGVQSKTRTPNAPLLTIPKSESAQLLICFDSEQVSGSLQTDLLFKKQPAIASASGFSFAATASPGYPFDLIEKVQQAWDTGGPAYLHILCPCPETWGFAPENTVRIARMAVETALFPLYEIHGGYYSITVQEKNRRPVADYIRRQDRFSSWKGKKLQALQQDVDAAYESLCTMAKKSMQ